VILPTTISLLSLCVIGLAMAAAPATREGEFTVRRSDAALANLLLGEHPAWGGSTAVLWGPEPYTTEFRALHTETGLALRFAATDSAPWHTMTERDDHIWNEEVVEIFIDPDGDGRNYAEIEINPINVVCDLQIFATEPRLSSDIAWDFVGIETRVVPLLDDTGEATGWLATATLPWDGFAALDGTDVSLPPKPGDRWQFNLFRIKRPGGPQAPEEGAIYAPWSPTPSLSFHAPVAFRDLLFVATESREP